MEKTKMRRLNVNLPETVFKQLQELANESGQTLTQVVRNGLGLADIAYKEATIGHKLAITDKRGKVLKEIALVN